MRLTYAAITISILLLASIAFPIGTASANKKIVAHATIVIDFGTCTPPAVTSGCISIRDVDGDTKQIVTRDFFFVQSGEFPGHGNGVDTITVDGFILTSSAAGSFTGSVAGREGTFRFENAIVIDLSPLAGDPPARAIIEGNVVVVEGTGVGGFEGICGFGTFTTDEFFPVEPVDITWVLVFGDDCEDFSVGDFLDILNNDD